MTRAFVSYSRKDTEFTRKLTDALIEQQMELWIDWKNIPPTVDWKLQIQKGVEEAETFLFLISPDSIKSRECAEELIHAVKNNKRLIPLVVRDIKAEDAPNELKHINWIFFDKPDCFDDSFHKLLEAIKTDYEWVQTHSRLQVKALEWERHKKDQSLLLRGMELENMEGQLVVNASKEPKPTDIQREYVLESKKAKEAERKAREKQRRLITASSVVVAVLMLVMAVWAFRQRNIAKDNEQIAKDERAKALISQKVADSARLDAEAAAQEAEKQSKIARINEIIGLAVAKKDQDYNQALLYSVEAYRRAEESNINLNNAKTALLTTLQDRRGLVQILPGHNDWISKVIYSKDGNTLVTSSYDEVIILWDTSDPKNPINVKQLRGHDAVISPDNKVLVTAGYDKDYNSQVILWDISDKTNPRESSSFIGAETLIAFSSDNSKLITGTWVCDELTCDSFIQIRDISDPGTPLGTIKGDSARLSPDDRILATAGYDDTLPGYQITFWDITDPLSPEILNTIPGENGTFSPDNTILAVSTFNDGGNSVVQLWDISNPRSPQKRSEFLGNSDWVSTIVFSFKNNKLLVGGDDGFIHMWDISDPSNPRISPSSDRLKAHTSYVNNIAFNSGGSTFSTGGSDGQIMIWDMDKIKSPIQFDMPEGLLASREDGNIILSRTYAEDTENFINQLWDVTVLSKPVQLGTLDSIYIDSAIFSPDGRFLNTTQYDFETENYSSSTWDISDPAKPVEFKISDQNFDAILFGTNSNILTTQTYDPSNDVTTTTLWDISDPGDPIPFETTDQSTGIVFSPDNTLLAYPNWSDGIVVFWDVRNMGQFKRLGSLNGSEIAFSSDGKIAAITVYGEKPLVELWDISDWKTRKLITTVDGFSPTVITDRNLVITQMSSEESSAIDLYFWDVSNPSKPVNTVLKGHTRYINSIVLSPDRKMVASASDDRTVILWDISEPGIPRELVTLKGHRGNVYTVKFNKDGSILASASSDGGVFLWDVTDPSKVNQLAYLKINNWLPDFLTFNDDGRILITSDAASGTVFWDLDPKSWVDKACHIANTNFTSEEWVQLFKGDRYRKTCENVGVPSTPAMQPEEPVISPGTTDTATSLPLCTDTDAAYGCPLVTWNASENERDQFCIDSVSYTLYALPEGTTLTPVDPDFTCTDEGVHGGFQMYTCYSLEHPNVSFQATMCSTSCQVPESDQCESGFGLDSSQSCCAPVSTDGCTEVTLELGTCANSQ